MRMKSQSFGLKKTSYRFLSSLMKVERILPDGAYNATDRRFGQEESMGMNGLALGGTSLSCSGAWGAWVTWMR
jgi:hypothetical protein